MTATFPGMCKIAKVITVHKGGESVNDNYRPISLKRLHNLSLCLCLCLDSKTLSCIIKCVFIVHESVFPTAKHSHASQKLFYSA